MAENSNTDAPPSSSPTSPQQKDPITLHTRREPFEYGLLPIPKLIYTDGTVTLGSVKDKLLQQASSDSQRVDDSAIAEILQISPDHARLVIDTLAAVHPSDSDPLVVAKPDESPTVGVNVFDLILFLCIQSYKRLLPRTHKDSAAVADVWPSTSAFDGYLSALSPLQVLPMERFEHLGFLIHFGVKGSEAVPLSQAAPFFANSDPDMPAAPVPAAQVHDWLLQKIADALEQIAEKATAKENGPSNAADQDVAMADANTNSAKASTSSRGLTFIEGISKSSFLKQATEVKGSLKVLNCHDTVIYVLAPLRYATIYGCSDATIVLGAVGKALRVEHCERVHVISAAKRVCIANCRECMFYLGVNQRPLIVGDNHKLQVAPYNTFYPQLEEHMSQVGVEPTVNKWNDPLPLGVVDPHDSLSHPAGVSDAQAETAALLDPDQFTNFLIPNWFGGEVPDATKDNPFSLPEAYMASQHKNNTNLGEVKQVLQETPLDESKKRELSCALHVLFKDWLYASGNIRQLYCLHGD
ncbi:TBCC domain-containing protein 1 [Bienertia sinuspersici]